jgi:hypothetical protein
MISHHVYYQLAILGFLWLFVILHSAWPSRCATTQRTPAKPIMPRRQRSKEPKPFAGFTHKPPCALCEHETAHPQPRPPVRPAPMPPTNRRPRVIETSRHFCPHDGCAYRGWLGLGNLRANGLPTICQPQFVKFLPHLHDRLTTNPAGIIARAMTQHGHQDTQQSTANIA